MRPPIYNSRKINHFPDPNKTGIYRRAGSMTKGIEDACPGVEVLVLSKGFAARLFTLVAVVLGEAGVHDVSRVLELRRDVSDNDGDLKTIMLV